MSQSLVTDPQALIQAAVAGFQVRGEQDEMLRVEAQLPGFGGFFIDEGQRMVVYLRPVGRPEASVVRDILARQYGSRPEARVREVMAHLAETRIIDGQFSLSELIAVENNIARSRDQIPGFVGVGVSLVRNRVKLGFADASSMQAGMNAVASLGVPLAAVSSEVWGEMVGANWGNSYRPVFGGLMIDVANKSVEPDTTFAAGLGSYGYTVTDSFGRTYFMVAAHVPNGFHFQNGATGDTVFQGKRSFAPIAIGTIVINPQWRIFPCSNADFCPIADVALGQFINGVTGTRKVGTSIYEGLNGNAGTQTINAGGPYPVREPVTPEWVDTTAHGIHKSGFHTGTTTGQIIVPRTTGYVRYSWGTIGATRLAYYENLTRVEHMGWGGGDSGGPVFAGNGGAPYYTLGIVVAGGGHQNAEQICDAGMECVVLFIRWTDMETQLGIGRLNPATTQSPSPPPSSLSVSIDGPTQIRPGATCTWQALVANGTAPFTYQWTIDGLNAGTNQSATGAKSPGTTGPSFTVGVSVIDASGSSGDREITVSETSSAPICMT